MTKSPFTPALFAIREVG